MFLAGFPGLCNFFFSKLCTDFANFAILCNIFFPVRPVLEMSQKGEASKIGSIFRQLHDNTAKTSCWQVTCGFAFANWNLQIIVLLQLLLFIYRSFHLVNANGDEKYVYNTVFRIFKSLFDYKLNCQTANSKTSLI